MEWPGKSYLTYLKIKFIEYKLLQKHIFFQDIPSDNLNFTPEYGFFLDVSNSTYNHFICKTLTRDGSTFIMHKSNVAEKKYLSKSIAE